ncbi:ABC transporter ATP-binding protein [Corynebacterium amycolatum]|uniref:ABC transporter ATP-binding protein n=1 Tax=Corynebacterium amycolatum TaxID=43765 RepID=UPI00211A7E44|nr:ABC transporter ATP-binding protein [Corynebacterium amycolatum]MCQ9170953.1 ABC transporter ATP-binding protein [Corynebacterium amycolatum]
MTVLEVTDLHKSFGSKTVLDGVSLTLEPGEIYGFLGRNGSGKTTAIRAILGLTSIDSGELKITAKRVGFLPDVPTYYPWMRADEFLKYCGRLCGLRGAVLDNRVELLLSLAKLTGQSQRVMDFSRGMRQRLGIAQALIDAPELLILDEPTSALDPIGRHDVLSMIKALRGQATVLFSTHLLNDAEKICDRVGILHDGKIVAEGPLSHLLTPTSERLHLVVSPGAHDKSSTSSKLQSAINRSGWVVESSQPEHRSLEEVFIAATGRE